MSILKYVYFKKTWTTLTSLVTIKIMHRFSPRRYLAINHVRGNEAIFVNHSGKGMHVFAGEWVESSFSQWVTSCRSRGAMWGIITPDCSCCCCCCITLQSSTMPRPGRNTYSDQKPPYSYIALTAMAIQSSPDKVGISCSINSFK